MGNGSYKEQMFINWVKLQIFRSLQPFICEFAKKKILHNTRLVIKILISCYIPAVLFPFRFYHFHVTLQEFSSIS